MGVPCGELRSLRFEIWRAYLAFDFVLPDDLSPNDLVKTLSDALPFLPKTCHRFGYLKESFKVGRYPDFQAELSLKDQTAWPDETQDATATVASDQGKPRHAQCQVALSSKTLTKLKMTSPDAWLGADLAATRAGVFHATVENVFRLSQTFREDVPPHGYMGS